MSGHSESTVRRFADSDLAAIAHVIEALYAQGMRRFAVRSALTETARAAAKAQLETNEK